MPTELARGPWFPDALHGGPVAALIAREVQRCEPRGDLEVARISLELLRPVPIAPLEVASRLTRPGRRIQVVEVVVRSGETEVAQARAVRIRRLKADHFPDLVRGPVAGRSLAGPEESVAMSSGFPSYRAYHNSGVEIRFALGAFDSIGPAAAWIRLRHPVVVGEDPSPLERVAAAADFGNGISAEMPFGSGLFINPDLTFYMSRMPVGEWICLDARTYLGTPGLGLAESALSDERGLLGRALQSLLVEPYS